MRQVKVEIKKYSEDLRGDDCEKIVQKFAAGGFAEHPVWILLRDIDQGVRIAEKMIESVRDKIGYNDAKVFELTRATLPQLFSFLSLKAFSIRIAVCVLRSQDEFLNASILKKIEDVPENTVFIIVAQNLSQTLYSRGMVFNLEPQKVVDQKYMRMLDNYPGFDQFYGKVEDFDPLPETINAWIESRLVQCIQTNEKQLLKPLYESWKKFLDIRSWIESEQVNKTNATEMMLSILHLSSILD